MNIFLSWCSGPHWPRVCSLSRLHDHMQAPTQTHSVGLLWKSDQLVAESSTWQHNTHERRTDIPSVGFEPTIPVSELPQTHVLHTRPPRIGIWVNVKCTRHALLATADRTKNTVVLWNLLRLSKAVSERWWKFEFPFTAFFSYTSKIIIIIIIIIIIFFLIWKLTVQSTAPQGSPGIPATRIVATTPELIVRILNSVFFKFSYFLKIIR